MKSAFAEGLKDLFDSLDAIQTWQERAKVEAQRIERLTADQCREALMIMATSVARPVLQLVAKIASCPSHKNVEVMAAYERAMASVLEDRASEP